MRGTDSLQLWKCIVMVISQAHGFCVSMLESGPIEHTLLYNIVLNNQVSVRSKCNISWRKELQPVALQRALQKTSLHQRRETSRLCDLSFDAPIYNKSHLELSSCTNQIAHWLVLCIILFVALLLLQCLISVMRRSWFHGITGQDLSIRLYWNSCLNTITLTWA